MRYSKIKILKKNENFIEKLLIKSEFGEIKRDVIVQLGKEMVVKPLSPKKLQHRDRRVLINKISDEGFIGVKANVRFLDTNRQGKVDVTDLDDLI